MLVCNLAAPYITYLPLLYDAPIRRELKQMPFWRSVRKEVEKELKMENGKLKMENEKKVSLQPD